MKIEFRIDFGYQYLYSRRHYHPRFIWDGTLSVDKGEITSSSCLDYPVSWFGPCHRPTETALEGPEWKITTKRGVCALRFCADVEEDSVFTFDTVSFKTSFSAKEIIEKGRLDFPLGPKYLGCSVIVTKDGYLWFRPQAKENETVYDYDKLNLPVKDWERMTLAWLAPGEKADVEYDVPKSTADYRETLFHVLGMASKGFAPDRDGHVEKMMQFDILLDGEKICSYERYYRFHDMTLQMIEDEWQRLSLPEGKHTLSLVNRHPSLYFGISKITLTNTERNHSSLNVPEWMLKDEKLFGRVFAAYDDRIEVSLGKEKIYVDCTKGWNEFPIETKSAENLIVRTEKDEKTIEVYDVREEKIPVKVGYDMTTVPHDDTGVMDNILDYTYKTRLGNYVVFRSFMGPVEDRLLEKWSRYCALHGIWSSACNNYTSGAIARGSGEMFHDCGEHECTGTCYAADPDEENSSKDMKEASEKFISSLKVLNDRSHTVCRKAAFGDPSGGTRYCYLAGSDFVRAETMVSNTMMLLSQTRPAAEALGDGTWGVHIAIQHNFQPYHENHLGQYFLSMMQPWMMGAEVIYEEDSLFNLFKEERQAWDDLLTKGKRDMTRSFFKFAKTHPRKGKNVRNIAYLEGRYAAPFNGFICDSEQDPHYSVWGKFGNSDSTWGHCQPEKAFQVLDVLMPGACTHPLRQRFDKRRMFFAGTPYGDFDRIPAEADADYFDNYSLIMNLGWNTMIDEDYDKIKKYVSSGGTYLTGIPQFSTHIKRDFLRDMNDLSLYRDGDLSELCGIKVNGRGEAYCGQWNCPGRDEMEEASLSAMPSDSSEEDGEAFCADIELAGAEVVAWDSFSGAPLLVRNRFGKGYVYTFTIWAYPGHEKFRTLSASWVKELAKENRKDTYVRDDSGEIFWTVWEDGEKKTVMVLNTDWTSKGNEKKITLVTKECETELYAKEREALIIDIENGNVSVSRYTL